MSSVVTSRTTPTKESSPVTPPMTSADKSAKVVDKDTPIDIDIPDNYVSWTLKNQKARPPITWDNWWKELNYLSLTILTVTPAIAIYGAMTVPLRWQTAVFSVFYYFVTGLGEPFFRDRVASSTWREKNRELTFFSRYYRWLPPALGAPLVQRVEAAPVFPCGRR